MVLTRKRFLQTLFWFSCFAISYKVTLNAEGQDRGGLSWVCTMHATDCVFDRSTVSSLFKTMALWKYTFWQGILSLTHFLLCDFDAIWCAILRAARQDIWAKNNLGFHVLCHIQVFNVRGADIRRRLIFGIFKLFLLVSRHTSPCLLLSKLSAPSARFLIFSGCPARRGSAANWVLLKKWGYGDLNQLHKQKQIIGVMLRASVFTEVSRASYSCQVSLSNMQNAGCAVPDWESPTAFVRRHMHE